MKLAFRLCVLVVSVGMGYSSLASARSNSTSKHLTPFKFGLYNPESADMVRGSLRHASDDVAGFDVDVTRLGIALERGITELNADFQGSPILLSGYGSFEQVITEVEAGSVSSDADFSVFTGGVKASSKALNDQLLVSTGLDVVFTTGEGDADLGFDIFLSGRYIVTPRFEAYSTLDVFAGDGFGDSTLLAGAVYGLQENLSVGGELFLIDDTILTLFINAHATDRLRFQGAVGFGDFTEILLSATYDL